MFKLKAIFVDGSLHSQWGIIHSAFLLCVLLSCCDNRRAIDIDSLMRDHRISATELKSLTESGTELLIIDVRHPQEFATGRIPGAQNVWRPQIASDSLPNSSISAPAKKMEQLLSSIGAKTSVPLVLYDFQMNADAANLWWILWRYGKRNVLLLDGGLLAWKESGGKINTLDSQVTSSDFRFDSPEDLSRYASLETVKQALSDSNTILLDVRSREEFLGDKNKGISEKPGRIPGSRWMNYSDLTEEKNGSVFFKSKSKIQSILNAMGIVPSRRIICYCQSGVRSAHTTFVLTEMMGYEKVLNYDGSWQEWSQQEDLPFETGGTCLVTEKSIN